MGYQSHQGPVQGHRLGEHPVGKKRGTQLAHRDYCQEMISQVID